MVRKLLRRSWLYATLMVLSASAHAAFHAWQITEVYSNASGTVQFIELDALFGGQQFLQFHEITSSQGGTTNTFVFPTHLPADTAGRKMLIGTAGFAALNIVTPDYVVPDGFLFTTNGRLVYAGFYDIFSYASLPVDGVLSLNRDMTTGINSPTNFAGATGTIAPPATPPDAPLIGTAIASIGQVSVTFTPPLNNGGAAITRFNATCGARNASGPASPIVVTGLAGGVPVSCTVSATNDVGTGPPSSASNPVTPPGVPAAPVIGAATPGNASVSIAFSAPATDGGSPIVSYTANCTSGATSFFATGSTAPLFFTGLTNGLPYTCSVSATNAVGIGPSSGNVIVTPSATGLAPLVAVLSRKTHNGAVHDLPVAIGLPPGAPITIEPRMIGTSHLLVFQFDRAMSATGTVAVSPAQGNYFATALNNEILVTLNGIADNQRITVTLTSVDGVPGDNATASIGFLVGDISGNGAVSASDISGVKAHLNLSASATNFRYDIDLDGTIAQKDVSAVKARSGRVVP